MYVSTGLCMCHEHEHEHEECVTKYMFENHYKLFKHPASMMWKLIGLIYRPTVMIIVPKCSLDIVRFLLLADFQNRIKFLSNFINLFDI